MPSLDEPCPQCTDGKHLLAERPCHGTKDHNDMGGRIYRHEQIYCVLCEVIKCDFTNAEPIAEGWY
jgi:hypothetical protein